jgi:phospholipid/cholesterol/gamma-HCH transport system substrate-binding protein
MNRTLMDLWVGIFVALGVVALVFLGMRVGNLTGTGMSETYDLVAKFDNIGGLKVKAPVKSAGVLVGRVADIRLDGDTFQAVVVLRMDKRYQFPKDTFASILTAGLLGEQYIGFDVGGDPDNLKGGDTLKKTQSAVVLEKLIGQFMFDKAAEGKGNEKEK